METERPSRRRLAIATLIAVIISTSAMAAQIVFLALLEDPQPYSISDYFGAMVIAGFLGIILAVPTWPLALIWAALA